MDMALCRRSDLTAYGLAGWASGEGRRRCVFGFEGPAAGSGSAVEGRRMRRLGFEIFGGVEPRGRLPEPPSTSATSARARGLSGLAGSARSRWSSAVADCGMEWAVEVEALNGDG